MNKWEIEENSIKLNGNLLAFKTQHEPKLTGLGKPNPFYWYCAAGLDAETSGKVKNAILTVEENAPVEALLAKLRQLLSEELD